MIRGICFVILTIAALTAGGANVSTAQSGPDECPARGMSWTYDNIRQCIDEVSKRIEQSAPGSTQRAELLAQRAELHRRLAGTSSAEDGNDGEALFEAALADYSAALAITPQDAILRRKRAHLLMEMNRGEDALKDADILVAHDRSSVINQNLRGSVLALLKRHQEAIEVFTYAIALAQSCAEATAIQRQINEYRHAFDPPPTREQALEKMKNMAHSLYDMPEPSMTNAGFPCAPTPSNTFTDLVSTKPALFMRRAESYRALGNTSAAHTDYEYAVSISRVPELESIGLCDLEIELRLDHSAVESCRRAFGLNTYVVFNDPEKAAKIGRFLLEDGDLKGACRVAFPFAELPFEQRAHEGMEAYVNNPNIKALQQRVGGGLQGAGLKTCGIVYRVP